jgi:hypothetical protein
MILANSWYLINFTWDKVDYLDRDGLPASLRVVLVCVLTLVLMALLAAKAIVVGVMSVELNDFPTCMAFTVDRLFVRRRRSCHQLYRPAGNQQTGRCTRTRGSSCGCCMMIRDRRDQQIKPLIIGWLLPVD